MVREADPILPAVEAFIAREGISPTSFGKSAINDPGLVHGLRKGRELRKRTRDRVFAFLSSPKMAPATQEAR
ncbi:hypothetical protein [Acetobacter sp. P5B1]|uniref:hypothetical protein n=1 Tax=Acetobacter sp. P5B1 TaxID=2762620 RepID=UPI001C04FE86|nr:hypothetical protein [Acetobacter sp. P5B1]